MNREEAQLYALVHDGAPGDLAFYERVCGGARTVLELGSGTGRVTRALVALGLEVTGLELDPGMLEEARAQPTEGAAYLEGDMRAFSLGRTFDRVIIPFSGVYCLESAADLDACFACVAAHLAPDGVFAFDAYAADNFHAESRPEDYPDDAREPVAEIVHEGERLKVLERSAWDRDAQRMRATYEYRRADGSLFREITIGHRYVLTEQIPRALERAGLSLVGIHGSFDGEPFGRGSGSVVVLAERA